MRNQAAPDRQPAPPFVDLQLRERVQQLHRVVLATQPTLCSERALLVTEYYRSRQHRGRPITIEKASATAHILANKRARIYDHELLVGNFTSHRVGGGLFPELHGVPMLEDLFRMQRRPVNPFRVVAGDRWRLLTRVLPFWLTRFLAVRAFSFWRTLRFVVDQLWPTAYIINETGGISHFVPSYSDLLARGTDGYRSLIRQRRAAAAPDGEAAQFLDAVEIACDGLDTMAARFVTEALRLSALEADDSRRGELEEIAAVCSQVPRHPARSFREALQSILFAQVALNVESLDNSVSPGRLDRVLGPFYAADVAAGRLDPAGALELLGCFAIKLCELVPFFSERLTRIHGGMFNGQVVVIGGIDRDGKDATNDVSFLFIELMDRLRTRQPNYHARLHAGSRPDFKQRIATALAAGAVSPALYNDEVIVPVVQSRGVAAADARDYANVGCVEPVPAGKGFFSTDAALFNLPLCLELALNQGRRFGSWRRIGAATPPATACVDIEPLFAIFAAQVEFGVRRLLADLRGIERAHTRRHPTPLTSMLLEGCITNGRDASAGGAMYNGSGVQGVGAVEVGDSLAAIDTIVFAEKRATLAQVIAACARNFDATASLRARLERAPKFGRDEPLADRWVGRVMQVFADCLTPERNTRGGGYAAGFYSVTSHRAFGEVVAASPSGRNAGAPFSSGISARSGARHRGPTAALLSAASLPLHRAGNGVNFNLELAPFVGALGGERGAHTVRGLIEGGFAAGCMQLQLNVLDPAVLVAARDNPRSHPGLLVRVSGYSAYFDDLTPQMQQEIIDRTFYAAG